MAAFARQCGIAESVLRTYQNDGQMPPLDKALAIAVAGGITVDWLATERGRRVSAQVLAAYGTASGRAGGAEGPQTRALDPVVLKGILKAVLEAQGERATQEHAALSVSVDRYQCAT